MTEVPYISQLGNAPRNDCGPACALMLARWVKPAITTTVAELSARYDPQDDGTTANNLDAALRWLGVTPTRGSAAQYPYIMLANYLSLPANNRYDSVARLHWVVRLGDTLYHDPYHVGTRGANLVTPKATLDAAEAGAHNRVGIVERPMARDEGRARVAYGRVFHVIPADTPEDVAVEIFRAAWRNNRQTVGGSYDDAGLGTGLSSKTAILHRIPEAQRQAFRDFYSQWYPSTIVQFSGAPTPPTPDPPPVQTGTCHIGLNCLNDAEAARMAYSYGCRFFLIMDNYPIARELADKGAMVLFRRYIHDWKLDGEQIANAIIEASGYSLHPAVIHTLWNEYDSWGIGSADDARNWANMTRRAVEIILSRGSRVAIGSWPVGNPDITNPAIVQALREYWAPIYNMSDRVYIDQHTYSPRPRLEMDYWHELRWQWYFTHCGFSPDARRIVAGETGIDQGGIGGFPAHNMTAQQVVDWCRAYRAASAKAITVNGKVYASPFVGGAIFQCGGHPGWQGYNVAGYLAAMRDAQVWL